VIHADVQSAAGEGRPLARYLTAVGECPLLAD